MLPAHPLLLTKLHVPAPRPPWVRRERLFERLDQAAQAPVTLLTAPAGYGKTALLAQWSAERMAAEPACRVAWLTLDEGDNDPVRFWAYLAAALQAGFERGSLGKDFLDMLQAPQPPAIEQLLVFLINEIALVPAELALVLDDVQALGQPEIARGLGFFVERLPGKLHLVLAGRGEPPLPVARLRARGQLAELHAADLRFSPDETDRFFRECTALDLTAADVAVLNERAEGWVAGLQLAAISLEGLEDKAAFIRAFSGDDRNVLDYLTEEILARQAPAIQDFLLRTSILERMSAELCEAVLGNGDLRLEIREWRLENRNDQSQISNLYSLSSQSTLESLERANLFLIPLDNRREWFRYHRLFADLLQARLRRQDPAALPDLHRRAARWLAANGLPLEAFRHAIAAGDLDLAAGIVGDQLESLMTRGEAATLAGWLEAFPPEYILGRAELCLGQAWVSLYALRFDQAESWAVRAGGLLGQTQGEDASLGQVEALRATAAINFKEFDRGIALCQAALRHLPETPRWALVKSLINLNLGDASSTQGDFPAAIRALEASLEGAHPSGNHTLEVIIIGSLGDQYLHQGRLRQAEAVLRQARLVEKDMVGEGNGALLAAGKPLAYLARIYLEWNELGLARETAAQALDYCQRWNHPDHLLDAYLDWAEICGALGDEAGAQAALIQAEEHLQRVLVRLAEVSPSAPVKPGPKDLYGAGLRAFRAQLRMRMGDWRTVERLLEETRDEGGIRLHPRDIDANFLLGMARLHTGRAKEALSLGQRLADAGQARPRLWTQIRGNLLTALAERALGAAEPAREALERALALAGPEGFVRTFLDGGLAAQEALEAYRRTGDPAHAAFVDRILAGFGAAAPGGAAPGGANAAAFSDRERQILRLLAAGRTNAEIAAELFLSTNTIKTHLKRVFEKLGAANRTEAATLARERGLI
jgi:LuxR family maltose regulon positive regulatory protein